MLTRKRQDQHANPNEMEKRYARLSAIVESSSDAIIGKTLEGKITTWNRGAERMFGYTAKQAIGKSITFLNPKTLKNEPAKLLQRIKKAEVINDYNSVRVKKDGTTFDVSISVSPILEQNGKAVGAMTVIRDISKRVRIMNELSRLAAMVEESHDAIIGKSLDGKVISWNGGAQKMFGYSAKEVIGKSMDDIVAPEHRKEMSRLMAKIKKGEIVDDYETVWLKKDGARVDVEFSMSPVHLGTVVAVSGVSMSGRDVTEKNILAAAVVARNISERKRVEEMVIAEKEKFSTMVRNLPIGIYRNTPGAKGHFLEANPAMLQMFEADSKEDFLKRNVSELYLQPEERRAFSEKILKNGFLKDEVMQLKTLKGKSFFGSLTVVMNKDKSGQVYFDGSIEDITERKTTEDRISELSDLRKKFLGIISHQLRTPLTAVNWNLESLLNGEYGVLSEAQQAFVHGTHSASLNVTRRVNDLLTAMDIEEGRLLFIKEDVFLGSICAGVFKELQKRCELKNLDCSYVAPQVDLPVIQGDAEKLRQAMMKMIENAIDYTKEGGKVAVKLAKKGNVLHFEVKDTGIGIPKVEQRLIYKRFFRASNASTMSTDSFGIGLSIAKHFINQHKGNMGFESKEGQGSTFWFELPLKS